MSRSTMRSAKWISTSTKTTASAGCTSSGTTRERSKTFRSCNRIGGRRFTRAPKWLAEVGLGLLVARWVNEARVGYNRLYQPTLPGDLNTPASSYGLDTGVSGPFSGGLPRISFGGYFFPGLGGFKWPKFQGPDSITQAIDHVSYTAGKHSLKFGANSIAIGSPTQPTAMPVAALPSWGQTRRLLAIRVCLSIPRPWRTFFPVRRSRPHWKWGIRRCTCITGPMGYFSRMTGGSRGTLRRTLGCAMSSAPFRGKIITFWVTSIRTLG